MSKLNDLRRPEGANRDRKRVGRGPGSGTGKTAGRGHKGQKARTGHHGMPAWFEGGQMPLNRRLPKRGFKNPFPKSFQTVNVGQFERIEEEIVTPELLHGYRLVDLGTGEQVKVLGNGEVTRKLTVKVHAISAGARAKIEAAGGTVELLES